MKKKRNDKQKMLLNIKTNKDLNWKDIEEIKPAYLKGLKFHYVSDIMEVLEIALLKETVN